MKWTFWFVTYNGMGGHPVLSFAPDILLVPDSNSFGNAVREFEFCAHVKPARAPVPASDFLMARFHDRLPTLPKAWFRRKKKRVEIAYHSHVGFAEDLLGGDFAAKNAPDALFTNMRRSRRVIVIAKKLYQKLDDFDVGGFLGYVESKTMELSTLDDETLLRRLVEAQAAERERVGRAR